MSDFTNGGTGYSFVPSTQATVAALENWSAGVYMILAASGGRFPDNVTRSSVAQMSATSLTALVNAGLLASP